MIKYKNECCSCAVPGYPCMGSDCPYHSVKHYYCDRCGREIEIYKFEDEELCLECILEIVAEDLEKVE